MNRDKAERARRIAALAEAPEELNRRGIAHTRKNNGRFEIRLGNMKVVDFHPSTGAWRVRESSKIGRGYDELAEFYHTQERPA